MNSDINPDYDPTLQWSESDDAELQLLYDEQHSPTAWEPINESD